MPKLELRLEGSAEFVQKLTELARIVAREEIASMLSAILEDDANSFEVKSAASRLLPLFGSAGEQRPGAGS